ncbi:sugar phosphate isomerase/epimerase family protein [Paenarthrobacter nicotinovorans]|uniref:sugar phosphate isomerase/epimerase family protein n=1 Tax=Paenarthrobacter nicotinovorans TaxID=29320 RepID=UPI003748F73A
MDLAVEVKANLCHFETITQLVPDLKHSSARTMATYAQNLALELSCGVVFLAPTHKERSPHVLELGRGDWLKGMQRVMDLAATAGAQRIMGIVGHASDRLAGETLWQRDLDETTGMLHALGPTLRDNGQKLLLKNHPEIDSSEIQAMIQAVGADVLGLAFDPVNVILRREEPAHVASEFGRHIGQIHLDDAVLDDDNNDLIRRLLSFGDGDVDWPAIFQTVQPVDRAIPLIVDRHQATIRVLAAGWQPGRPAITQNVATNPGTTYSRDDTDLQATLVRVRRCLAAVSV